MAYGYGPGRFELGVPGSYFFEAADPEVVAAVRHAIDTMQQLGATVHEVDLPHAEDGPPASWSIAYTESFAFHRENFFARSRDYTSAFLHKITGAACLTGEERVTAQRLRQVITSEFLAALCTVDAQWVLDFARLTGLDFVIEADAEPIAASVGPVKAGLAAARQRLASAVEPPVRSAPVASMPTW